MVLDVLALHCELAFPSLSSADGNGRFMAKFTSSRANACAISRATEESRPGS
jgi:hypothetical protein